MPVYSCTHGNNADLIQQVAALYLRQGMTVADVTYGKGVFWRKVDRSMLNFLPSDLKSGVDFRQLPYEPASVDVVVLDPPYVHDPGRKFLEMSYRNIETTRGMSHADIIELYTQGMTEAYRVLRPGGQLWVKCQDEISGGIQRWSHIELYQAALDLGYKVKDLFVLYQDIEPMALINANGQQHARKNHSYLWIFQR